MKMKVEPGTVVGFDGKEFKADKAGVVDVPAEAAAELLFHGAEIVQEKGK